MTKTVYPIDSKFLNRCKKITQEYDQLMGTWTISDGILHVISELAEIQDVLRNKNEKYGKSLSPEWYKKFYDEVADAHLTLFALDNILDGATSPNGEIELSNKMLNEAILTKLNIVQDRVKKLRKKTRTYDWFDQ